MSSQTKLTGKNIVLLVLDTASAFNMPMYGHERDTSPFLRQLAEENCLVNYAYANGAWTPPSHASIFSGQLPKEHGCTTQNLSFDANSFVEVLDKEGYTTYGFSNNKALTEANNFDKGFDNWISGKNKIFAQSREKDVPALKRFIEKEEERGYGDRDKYVDFLKDCIKHRDINSFSIGLKQVYRRKTNPGHVDFPQDSGADATNRLVEQTLNESSEPFFLFINYVEPHVRLNPPKKIAQQWTEDYDRSLEEYVDNIVNQSLEDNCTTEYTDRLVHDVRGLYDASLKYLDAKIEELYTSLTQQFDDTVFIITSDHGENLGHYDGMWDHQFGLWERLMRVPLIIAGDSIPNMTMDKQVSLRELHDLVLGNKEIEDLGSEAVFAEYYGKSELGDKPDNKQGSPEYNLRHNSSTAVVHDGEGYIQNSHIEDTVFRANEAGEKNINIPELRERLIQFKREIEDINI